MTTMEPRGKAGRSARAPVKRRRPAERRAAMVGHTVCILSDYENLRGAFGEVIIGDNGTGQVLVRMPGRLYGETRHICYLTSEVEVVACNDTLLHRADEECHLIARAVRLWGWVDYHHAGGRGATDRLWAAVQRRADRLKAQIRALQREAGTALVPWEGGAR